MLGLIWVLSGAWAQTVELPDIGTGSLRTRGMGGANVAVAEGASALRDNPAAMAIRRPYREPAMDELDSSIQLAAVPWVTEQLRSAGVAERFLPRLAGSWQAGLGLRVGRGAGALQVFEQIQDGDDRRLTSRWWSVGVGVSGSQWAVGITPHVVEFRQRLAGRTEGEQGTGLTAGALWAPAGTAYRLGARVRSPIRTGALSDSTRLRIPFEAVFGLSRTFGSRNRPGRYGPERTPHRWGGDWVMVDVDIVATGSGRDAVALEPLLAGRTSAVGGATLSVRTGVEAAVWHDQLRLRAGLATVPARGETRGVRGTLGVGVRIGELLGMTYRIAGSVGLDPRGWSLGLGVETW